MTPLAVSRMRLLVPLCLPSISAASPLDPLSTSVGPAEEGLQALLPHDQQVIVTCCHKPWGLGGQGPGCWGCGDGKCWQRVGCTLWQELCVLERPSGIGAIPGRAAMGTKPRYSEINSWTFWPGFCRTNLAGTRGN